MDFKSIISKIESIDGPIVTPKAPELPKSVQLNEDAQMRVLAGTSSILAEAKKKKAEEDVKEAAEKTATTWTDKSGKKHPATKVKGDKYTGKEAEKEEKTKEKTDEGVEPEFKSKFMKMVEAKKAEKEEKKKSKKEAMEEGKGDGNLANNAKPYDKVTRGDVVAGRLGKDEKGGKDKKVKEAAEKTPSTWTDKSGKTHPATKVKGDKYTGKEAEKEEKAKKTDESAMMPKGKKRPVKESVEQKLSFREMMHLVVESGGQQQIDAVDAELFAWAQRVARQKVGEGMKADVYAGLVYERMGGVFQMYDVLSEDAE